jgi:hypothetical protein
VKWSSFKLFLVAYCLPLKNSTVLELHTQILADGDNVNQLAYYDSGTARGVVHALLRKCGPVADLLLGWWVLSALFLVQLLLTRLLGWRRSRL